MKTTIVTENLIMLTRRNLVLPNAYLVRENDGFTLIDTTTGGGADKLIAAASRAGAKIRRVALTHGHGDHAGSLDALKQDLGDQVEVLIPELDARIHAGEQVVEGDLPGSWPKVTTKTRRCSPGRRPRRKPEGRRLPWAHAWPRRLSRHPRPVVDRRRRVHVNRQRSGHEPLRPPLPARPDGDLGQSKGLRIG